MNLIWYVCRLPHAAQTNSLLCSTIPYGTAPTLFLSLFPSFCHSSLYFVLPVRAPAPSHVFLCTLQVCLWPGQTKMTIVNGFLAEWLLLSAVCRPRDGSSTCADDSLTLDRLWRHTIPPTVHLSPALRSTRSGLIHDKTVMRF